MPLILSSVCGTVAGVFGVRMCDVLLVVLQV
jgi:hypothetical protein